MGDLIIEYRVAYLEDRDVKVIHDLSELTARIEDLEKRLRNQSTIEWYEAEEFGSGLTD